MSPKGHAPWLLASAAVGLCVAASANFAAAQPGSTARPTAGQVEMQSNVVLSPFYQQRMTKASPETKRRLESLQTEGRGKGWTFQVSYTEAMDVPLETLAGTRVPQNVLQLADRQNKFAAEAIALDNRAAIDAKVRIVWPACSTSRRKFDWAALGKVTPVKNQDGCGSCWAFGAMGVLESSWLIRNNETIDTSEQQVVACATGTGGADAGSCGGGWYDPVFQWAIAHGVGREVDMPYTASNGVCNAAMASPYRAVSWGFVTAKYNIPTVAQIKQAICDHGPVVVAVRATAAFQAYATGTFNEASAGSVNHAVVLTGWDEDRMAWRMKNSWGTGWGENGNMWIRYGANSVGHSAAWARARSKLYIVSKLPELVRKYDLVPDFKPFEMRELPRPMPR